MKLFSVYDTKAQFFLQPFPETSTAAAIRGFDVAVNEGKSVFSKFPDDFCLMEIAEFDQKSGELVPHVSAQNLGSARTVLRNAPEQMSLTQ